MLWLDLDLNPNFPTLEAEAVTTVLSWKGDNAEHGTDLDLINYFNFLEDNVKHVTVLHSLSLSLSLSAKARQGEATLQSVVTELFYLSGRTRVGCESDK